MGTLFAPTDQVVLARIFPDGTFQNQVLGCGDAIGWLLANADTPNLYFRASAHDGQAGYSERNCTSSRAFFVDIDYGSAGHAKPTPFQDEDSALGYLLGLPIKPSWAWHTGHGIQAAFLLDQPCLFPAGGGSPDNLLRYRRIASKLASMTMADSAFTPEHAYRVPCTINSKGYKHTDIPDIQGYLLWSNIEQVHTLEEIENACAHYGIEDHVESQAVPVSNIQDEDGVDAPYDELPQDIRDEIESGGERSDRLFQIIGRMIRAGYADTTIQGAIKHGPDFVEKFDRRSGGLARQVETCIAKIRSGRYVYAGNQAPPIRIYNVPVQVPLQECPELQPAFQEMLDRYASVAGIQLLDRVRHAARFYEYLFATKISGVLESPCGAGKSVWGLCHIAVHASLERRYLYVAETVEALHRAADMLEKLTETPVGRIHGFNAENCHALCGIHHTWRQCNPDNPKSVCHTCTARNPCAYCQRDQQITRPILCLTHNGLIRAMEDGSPLLEQAAIIVDEGLSTFNTWQVPRSDLEHLQRLSGIDLSPLFPYTSLACRNDLLAWQIPDSADVYARRNYVYRDASQTSALNALYQELRARLGMGVRTTGTSLEDSERANDTLAELTNFFRPSRYGDATYAYHESRDDAGWWITAKRNRFSFESQRQYRSLWILNASAQLAPYPYPDSMTVYMCPDLPDNSHLVTLHAIRANPTKTKQEEALRVSGVAMCFGQYLRKHQRILVAADKDSENIKTIREQIRNVCGDADIVILQRGRIKGVNSAGTCTLAYLGSMATFTGIDDCALHASLQLGCTFPDRPHVYTQAGAPNWPGGRMRIPAMRTYYALRSLDEIYQTIWRTAVRNDLPVEAIVVLPDEHWLTALWRTVMPAVRLGSAYREREGAETFDVAGQTQTFHWTFEQDPHLFGLRIIEMEPGQEISKKQVADELGYTGQKAWEKNKSTIMGLLEPFFEDGSTNRMLRRKAVP